MSSHQPCNILVTGGAGFIGVNFINYMLKQYSDITVVNLDKLTYAGDKNNLRQLQEDSRHHFIHGDICDQDLVSQLLQKYKIDTIVHFAAESHVDRSIDDPSAFVKTNLIGTYSLLEAARNFWLKTENPAAQYRFHHISTDEVYGTLNADDSAFMETTPYAPNSPYSATKAGSDHLVRSYFHTYGLPVTTSNCSNNYGPFQHNEKLIPTIINSCLQWQAIPIYGTGKNIRDWLHVQDHCVGIDAIIRRGEIGETYNLGGNNEKTNLEVVTAICKIFDKINPKAQEYASLIQFVNDRPGHDWRYAIDINKAQNELKWQPKIDFVTGLQETIAWYLDTLKSKEVLNT